jgi:hypothetical protein
MRLVSTVASALYAALPRQLRCPAPRKSEGARDFDALIEALRQAEPPPPGGSFDGVPVAVTRAPWDGPAHAVARRARH